MNKSKKRVGWKLCKIEYDLLQANLCIWLFTRNVFYCIDFHSVFFFMNNSKIERWINSFWTFKLIKNSCSWCETQFCWIQWYFCRFLAIEYSHISPNHCVRNNLLTMNFVMLHSPQNPFHSFSFRFLSFLVLFILVVISFSLIC